MKFKGFTLLEILVALVIVTTVFMVCYFSMSEMTKNTVVLKEKTMAILVANQALILAKAKNVAGQTQSNQAMGSLDFAVTIERKMTEQKFIDEIEAIIRNPQGVVMLNEKGYIFVPSKEAIKPSDKGVHTH